MSKKDNQDLNVTEVQNDAAHQQAVVFESGDVVKVNFFKNEDGTVHPCFSDGWDNVRKVQKYKNSVKGLVASVTEDDVIVQIDDYALPVTDMSKIRFVAKASVEETEEAGVNIPLEDKLIL